MSTCALHALFRPAKDAPRATRTRPCDQIISETRTPNMAQNLPAPSGFGCGDRQPAIGVPPRFVTVACYHADRTRAGLGNDTPNGRAIEPTPAGVELISLPRVGGVHQRYL
jgi:hypothetical protein